MGKIDDMRSYNLKMNKTLIKSISLGQSLSAEELVGHSKEMNKRIEASIAENEKKIALGMKKAQSIQMQ